MTSTKMPLVLACTVWIGACCGGTKETTEIPTPEPITEVAIPEAPGPEWAIPDTAVPGDVGDSVFAVAPITEGWDVVTWKAGKIDQVDGSRAKISVASGSVPNIPGSLIVPIPAELTARPGTVLLCDAGDAVQMCILDEIDGKSVTAHTVVDGEVTKLQLTVGKDVMKLTRGLNQLGVAAYPVGDDMLLGQVAVVSPTTVWMITTDGEAREVVRSTVVPIMPGKHYSVGDKVYGIVTNGKFRGAEVTAVKDDGLQYGLDYTTTHDDDMLAFWEVTDNITASEMPLKGFERGDGELQNTGDGPQRGDDGFQQGGTQRGSGSGEPRKVTRPNR
jgi:hypothetical protein